MNMTGLGTLTLDGSNSYATTEVVLGMLSLRCRVRCPVAAALLRIASLSIAAAQLEVKPNGPYATARGVACQPSHQSARLGHWP